MWEYYEINGRYYSARSVDPPNGWIIRRYRENSKVYDEDGKNYEEGATHCVAGSALIAIAFAITDKAWD